MTTTSPPPGWYPDQFGTVRWWDGVQWSHAVLRPPDTETGRSMAMLVHLSAFVGGFILPLVLLLTEGKKNTFVKHHATEALNFQITFLISYLLCIAGLVVTAIIGGGNGTPSPVVFVALILATIVLVVGHWVFAIIGCLRASKGEWWYYPVNIHFVSGSVERR